jgi:exodeoxyribonuclease VII small subunit
MAKNENKPIGELSYEQAVVELEAIVTALEKGEKPLQESMALFERGQALTKHCTDLLEKAELKVRTLVDDSLVDFKEDQ